MKEILNKVLAFRIYFVTKLLVMNHLLGSSFLLITKSMQPIDHKYNVFISAKDGVQPINTVGLYECPFNASYSYPLGLPYACIQQVEQKTQVSQDVLNAFNNLLQEYKDYER